MADRIVTIKLMAEATGLVQGFARAKDAAGELNAKVKESATSQRAEWATVGAGLTAVGVAVTGVGAAALKTGIQYNTLQQTSRAALTSLLGSAQAANAQMDKLDDFARNSPFSKSTFITAQQQMLAFGVEAQKVVPYLDAVQNAVAAAGGSNADIEGIVATMSKIQSSSKITAQDLNEFGNRGVNAAELIGSQMGKTGAQIRADITAGSLGAEEALDALAAGMSSNFEGAAANVKDTFEGSMDRVKAAWRDFSAELATPLVDPNGGGALVDLLNWAADAMRAFESLPEPVKNATSTLVGLAGGASLVLGTAFLVIPKIMEFKEALAKLEWTTGKTAGAFKLLGNAAVAAAGIATIAALAREAEADTTHLRNSLERNAGAVDALSKATDAYANKGWGNLISGFKEIKMGADDVADALAYAQERAEKGIFMITPVNMGEMQSTLGVLKEMGSELSSVAETNMPKAKAALMDLSNQFKWTADEQWAFIENSPKLKAALEAAAEGFGLSTDKADLLKLAFENIEPAAEDTSNSLEKIQGTAVDTSEAISKLADEILSFGSAQIDADRSAIAFEEQLGKLNERLAEGATGLDLTTEAGRANKSSLLDVAEAANKAAADVLKVSGSQEAANEVLSRARERLVAAGVQYGDTAAAAAAYVDEVLLTPETLTTVFHANTAAAEEAVARYKSLMSDVGGVINTTLNVMTNLTGENKASGGTVGYASGGTVGSNGAVGYASGGTIPGINGGVRNGTVYGLGTAKSDSVNVNLSRGEEVIQEPFASLHRPMLKAINRGDFMNSTPMAMQQASTKIVEVPTRVTVVDAGNQFVTTMQVVANREIDQFVEQQSSVARRTR